MILAKKLTMTLYKHKNDQVFQSTFFKAKIDIFQKVDKKKTKRAYVAPSCSERI